MPPIPGVPAAPPAGVPASPPAPGAPPIPGAPPALPVVVDPVVPDIIELPAVPEPDDERPAPPSSPFICPAVMLSELQAASVAQPTATAAAQRIRLMVHSLWRST
jgi:hypothetical protein